MGCYVRSLWIYLVNMSEQVLQDQLTQAPSVVVATPSIRFANTVVKNKPKGRRKLDEANPALVGVIKQVISTTGSVRKAALATGISRPTVEAILTRHPEEWAAAKKALATRALIQSDKCLDLAYSKADKLSPFQAIIGAKVMGQMALEQLGQMPAPTVNVGIVLNQVAASLSDLQAEVDRRKAEPVTIDVATVAAQG